MQSEDIENYLRKFGEVLEPRQMEAIMLDMHADTSGGKIDFGQFEFWWEEANALRYRGAGLGLKSTLNRLWSDNIGASAPKPFCI